MKIEEFKGLPYIKRLALIEEWTHLIKGHEELARKAYEMRDVLMNALEVSGGSPAERIKSYMMAHVIRELEEGKV